MLQTISGIVVLLIGGYALFVGFRHATHESADQQKGFIGRFGVLMVAILMLLVGVALVVPAQNAEPTESRVHPSFRATLDLSDFA